MTGGTETEGEEMGVNKFLEIIEKEEEMTGSIDLILSG